MINAVKKLLFWRKKRMLWSEFEKQNPDDFDELGELISELANIYEGDEGVRKSISALM